MSQFTDSVKNTCSHMMSLILVNTIKNNKNKDNVTKFLMDLHCFMCNMKLLKVHSTLLNDTVHTVRYTSKHNIKWSKFRKN